MRCGANNEHFNGDADEHDNNSLKTNRGKQSKKAKSNEYRFQEDPADALLRVPGLESLAQLAEEHLVMRQNGRYLRETGAISGGRFRHQKRCNLIEHLVDEIALHKAGIIGTLEWL